MATTTVRHHSARSGRGVRTAAAVAASACALAACAGPSAAEADHLGEVRAVEIGTLTASDVAVGQQAFGLDLLHLMCAAAPEENLLISPTSAAEALGLLLPAARGATGERLSALLHQPHWSPDLVAATQQHTDALLDLAFDGDTESPDAPDFLNVSNRVWARPGLQPDQAYLDDVATAFRAGVHEADFAGDPAGATDRINDAVSQDTAGIIDQLFDAPLSPDTVAVLTNAVHLKARWETPFQLAVPGDFAAPTGPTSVEMMHGGTGTVREADGWTAVELAYRDGTLAAVAVLPPEGTDPCALDLATLDALDAADGSSSEVHLPRLSLEQSHELLGPLEGLGLDPLGDYGALCGGCEVSRVVQDTFLELDEEGTEAAAATGVAMEESAAAFVRFDRPFVLLLTDTATRSPLFVGVINDPSA